METIMDINNIANIIVWGVPILIIVATLTVLLLDWMFSWVKAIIDDFEQDKYPMKLSKYFMSQGKVKEYMKGKWVVAVPQGGYIGRSTETVWRTDPHILSCCAVDTKEEAEEILAIGKLKGKSYVDLSIPTRFLCVWGVIIIASVLPMIITLTVGTLTALVLLARQVTRGVKKLKAHVNDPEAHKGDTNA